MNEEIEYAEMLEIPVSTVNVIRKTAKKRSKTMFADERQGLKDETISRVNEKVHPYAVYSGKATPVDPVLDAKSEYPVENDLETVLPTKKERAQAWVLKAEFGVACALCLGIFLTNVWMPNSAINTFFRSLIPEKQIADERDYTDFTLSSILGADSDAEMTLSPTGIISFVSEGCVYPTADGKVSALTQDENGKYTVTISHTDSFSGVITGLDYVYYEIGQEVKHNVPVGYSIGENEVQVAMYDGGNLLNCFSVTEENTLAWVVEAE